MKTAISKVTILKFVAAIAFSLAPIHSILSQSDMPERSIDGVWLVTITPRNFTTGDPIPNAAFESIFTLHKEGTMLVSLRNNSLTLERTTAHGLWARVQGWSEYSYKFVHLRRNVSTGQFAGKQESAGNLILSSSGHEFSSESSTTVFDLNGNPLPSSCATSTGTRFELD